jgi:rsbT co-antagonist protein RsbR
MHNAGHSSNSAFDHLELLELYDVTPEDVERIRAYGKQMSGRASQYTEAFYAWLNTQPEYEEHFSDPERLARVKKMQTSYWEDFFAAEIDAEYVQRRVRIGTVHAQIGLSLQAYFAAMNKSLVIFLENMYDGKMKAEEYQHVVRSITKMVHMDTAIVVGTYTEMVNQRIAAQSRSLMEMSTPVTSIWEGILLLPVVGIIDSKRAQDMMNAMLEKIGETRSRAMILDISGVAIVDTAVANHLIKITKATRLMGCDCTISGVSPAIAQTVVELGIDVGTVNTTATLSDALSGAFKTLNITSIVDSAVR